MTNEAACETFAFQPKYTSSQLIVSDWLGLSEQLAAYSGGPMRAPPPSGLLQHALKTITAQIFLKTCLFLVNFLYTASLRKMLRKPLRLIATSEALCSYSGMSCNFVVLAEPSCISLAKSSLVRSIFTQELLFAQSH